MSTMRQEEPTPQDPRSTLDLVFARLNELSTDTKQALKESREANLMSGRNHELLEQLLGRDRSSAISRAIPYAAALLAIVALLRTL